jgi:hypothetical protein
VLFLFSQPLQVNLLQLTVPCHLHLFSFLSLSFLDLAIFSSAEWVFYSLPARAMLVLVALIVLLVVFLLDWLDYLLEFLGGVFVEGVENGAGEFLPVSDDTVPLLFQGSLFNHGPVIILPVVVIRVHSQFH